MKITGVICEYNPLHLGHLKQLQALRAAQPDSATVCLMSGSYVQRGKPAVFGKAVRAQAAVLCGADLVLELPVTASLCSAEGFAAEGVRILSPFCHQLCFGAETADPAALEGVARALLSPELPPLLHAQLDSGCSFPAARQAAVQELGVDASLLSSPNNILAVEYCKAILSQGSAMVPMPILRRGGYHDALPDPTDPSATAVRQLLYEDGDWRPYVPPAVQTLFATAPVHTLAAGERAVLARLRTMRDEEFEALPYGSEGLWRKLMHAARQEGSLEDILTAAKSKRYTRSRLDRMVLCAFLGLTAQDLQTPAPYVRVLALNDRGREVLNSARAHALLPNIGQRMDHPWQALEDRCAGLYGVFAVGAPEPPTAEADCRISYTP